MPIAGMVVIVPFKPEHLAALRLQAMQASAQPLMTAEHGRELVSAVGVSRTALVDGMPIACAGLIQIWKGRAYAWSYLSEEAFRHWRAVHRAVLKTLADARWPRVEMAVEPRHAAAKRWAWHLGFDFECLARKWAPDGRDVELWARVN